MIGVSEKILSKSSFQLIASILVPSGFLILYHIIFFNGASLNALRNLNASCLYKWSRNFVRLSALDNAVGILSNAHCNNSLSSFPIQYV